MEQALDEPFIEKPQNQFHIIAYSAVQQCFQNSALGYYPHVYVVLLALNLTNQLNSKDTNAVVAL